LGGHTPVLIPHSGIHFHSRENAGATPSIVRHNPARPLPLSIRESPDPTRKAQMISSPARLGRRPRLGQFRGNLVTTSTARPGGDPASGWRACPAPDLLPAEGSPRAAAHPFALQGSRRRPVRQRTGGPSPGLGREGRSAAQRVGPLRRGLSESDSTFVSQRAHTARHLISSPGPCSIPGDAVVVEDPLRRGNAGLQAGVGGAELPNGVATGATRGGGMCVEHAGPSGSPPGCGNGSCTPSRASTNPGGRQLRAGSPHALGRAGRGDA